jgi:RND family efflux transporter MFP subunit
MNSSQPKQQDPAPQPESLELPQERPTPQRRRGRGLRNLGILGVLLLGTVGTVLASRPDLQKRVTAFFGPAKSQLIPYKVQKQKLVITVTERGNLESSKNEDVYNKVEGQTTLLTILPEGTRVKKGDLVAELDSATLKDNLVNQEIATRRALADYENALKTRQVAEISVKEYELGTFVQEIQNVEGEQTLAASELTRAVERLTWSTGMEKNGYISKGQVLADELSKMKAEISKSQAVTKMKVLKEYTFHKQITELQANVEKARSDELAKQATHNLEKTKLEKLERQIEECKLLAPNDGLIVYANDANQFRGNNQPQIEEGATVRERQKIFSLPDINNMQVNTKVHESMIDRVQAGQSTNIRVDAFANQPLTGRVKSVQPLPDPSSWLSSDIKVYTTLVAIEQSLSALRPGMTAEVTILIDTLDNVLCIPVTAVLPLKGKDYVYLITPEGPKRTEIKLGATNDILIEVEEGLKEGDLVAMNPHSLLTEEEKNEAFSATARAGSRAREFDEAQQAKSPGASPGTADAKGGPPADGAEAAKARPRGGRRGGAGGAMGAMFKKFQNLSPEDMASMKTASDEEKKALMRKAGFTDEEMQQMEQMRQQMMQGGGEGFGGGGFGGGGFGGGGGGFGGGGRGGPGGGGGRGGPGGGDQQQ